MPTTRYIGKEYLEILKEVKTKVLVPCEKEGRIPVIGVKVNGSMFVPQTNDGHDKDLLRHSHNGPCGIRREEHHGRLFW